MNKEDFDKSEARFLKGADPVIKDKDGNITGFVMDQGQIGIPIEGRNTDHVYIPMTEDEFNKLPPDKIGAIIKGLSIPPLPSIGVIGHFNNPNEMSWEHSNVKNAKYIPDTKTLEVVFSNGSTYSYYDVPLETWEDMKTADKIGSFVHTNLKQFKYEKK